MEMNRVVARRMGGIAIAIALVAGLLFVGVGLRAPSGVASAADVDPANFTNPQRNPYFPLKPGTVSIERGSEDGDRLHERTRVTHSTKTIQGVTTKVVRDTLWSNGSLEEQTLDWYAADNDGNVWYFGESTATYNRKGQVVSREGSWQAGVDGARAGIIMPADPGPTDAYRQEFLRGHAEDQAWIVSRHEVVRVPFGRIDEVVRSYEWTRLEPKVVSVKFYGPGLGIVREQDIAGGTERLELVRVTHS
jgi:hypothetical protein